MTLAVKDKARVKEGPYRGNVVEITSILGLHHCSVRVKGMNFYPVIRKDNLEAVAETNTAAI